MALFITFEGVEGSGKSTQIERLRRYLVQRGVRCKVTREPGGSAIGEKIRRILLNPGSRGMVPLAELFLYEAARAQHLSEVIAPLLRKGVSVLCDRFTDATIAYQSFGRGIDSGLVQKLNSLASEAIRPDVTFLLDCPSALGLKRATKRNLVLSKEDEGRFENEAIQFHRRVRRGYLAIAKKEPKRIRVIDGRHGRDEVFQEIRDIVEARLTLQKPGEGNGPKPGAYRRRR
jgi:dTMP kinase